MARRKLTFKSPNKMKLIVVVFAVLLVVSPQARYTTGNVLHATADILQGN